MSTTTTALDTAEASKYCSAQGHLFSGLYLTIQDLESGLSTLQEGLAVALSEARKGLTTGALTNVIAFARMVDIVRMRGLCEVAIHKKYPNYTTSSLATAKENLGFVRAGVKVLEYQMFFK